jgi:hypothetical protein
MALAVHRVSAQIPHRPLEASDTALQTLCQSTAAAIEGKQPENVSDRHHEIISVCEVSGPPVIADEWSRIASAGSALASLIDASRYIRDERIVQAVSAAALDESRSADVRIAAMNVLANYAVPRSGRWALREGPTPALTLPANVEDTASGAQPPVGTMTSRVDAVLQQVASGGAVALNRRPSRPTRDINTTFPSMPTDPHAYAADLRRALQSYEITAQFPIVPPNVTLHYVCGNRFRVRNKTPFPVVLQYDVNKDGNMHDAVRLPAASGGGDFTEDRFTAVSAGRVRIFYGGQPIDGADNAGTTCSGS